MAGTMTVDKMAAINQVFDSGLWEKADMSAVTYMASMSISPINARGRFHFIRVTSLSENLFIPIIAEKKQNGNNCFSMFTKTSNFETYTFSLKYSKILLEKIGFFGRSALLLGKEWMAVAACIILSIGSAMATMAEETVIQKGTSSQAVLPEFKWQEDSNGWKYVDVKGKYKKNCWEEINGYWYYFDKDGYMANDWTRIRGVNYCFQETGELELGWCYDDDEEKWYYFNEDGTAKKDWYQDDDESWYWFSSKGEMASSGYKNIKGKRYFFFDNGQLAANQYVGLFYMDENGWRNKDFDIVKEGKGRSFSVSSEIKDGFTEALKNIPREWIKKFNDQGWQILYYPNKEYFSAPLTGSGTYFVCHKLDTNYKKIKVCKPEDMTEAFGEYIGYASGCYKNGNKDATDLMMNKVLVEEFVDMPDYFADDMTFYFGKLVSAYVGSNTARDEMDEAAPEVTDILKKILYSQ